MDVDVTTAHERDREFKRLEGMRRKLEEERRAFAEATIQLGKERAELQAERCRLEEEKGKMEVDAMIEDEDLPLAPANPRSSLATFPPGKKRRNTEDSPPNKKPKVKPARKSPLQSSFGRGLGASRSNKRASLSASYAVLTSPTPPALLSTTFALPPPSPKASFPAPQPALLLSTPFEIPPPDETEDAMDVCEEPVNPSVTSTQAPPNLKVPETPAEHRRNLPFPMAKPYAPRMIHAYSPARPSPLSRILMLGNSPDSNKSDDSGLLEPVPEEEMFPEIPMEDREAAAQELGVSESPPESPVGLRPVSPPLQDRRGDPNAGGGVVTAGKSTTTRGRVIHGPSGAASSSKSRGAALPPTTVPPRRKPPPTTTATGSSNRPSGSTARLAVPATKEKENKGKAGASTQPTAPGGAGTSRPRVKPPIPSAQTGAGRGAPRRVPIGSVDAPPPGRPKK
ncbi:hypothetical protein PM082_011271 [Marasmius tenuissimus]|nr:hypothetical protein PM082_011271 [Marasmius tenuissimus]